MTIYWIMAGIYCITAMWFQKMLKEEIRKDPTIDNPTSFGWNVGVFVASFFWFLFILHDLLIGRNKGKVK